METGISQMQGDDEFAMSIPMSIVNNDKPRFDSLVRKNLPN